MCGRVNYCLSVNVGLLSVLFFFLLSFYNIGQKYLLLFKVYQFILCILFCFTVICIRKTMQVVPQGPDKGRPGSESEDEVEYSALFFFSFFQSINPVYGSCHGRGSSALDSALNGVQINYHTGVRIASMGGNYCICTGKLEGFGECYIWNSIMKNELEDGTCIKSLPLPFLSPSLASSQSFTERITKNHSNLRCLQH